MSSSSLRVEAPAHRAPPGPLSGSDQAERWARIGLLAVAVAFVAVHLVLAALDRPINWDEAVYLTQVAPDRPAVFFEPHRTRGMPLLVAPVAVLDPSMTVLRLYLVLVGALGLFAAFATWVRTIGPAAPVAAGLYAAHWVSIFYAVEVLPSFPSGLLAVAAGGLVAQLVQRREMARMPWVVAGVFLLYALVRPPDAVLVGVGGLAALALLRPGAVPRFAGVAGAGGAAGLGVWFLEGAVRFGFGPVQTMTSAGEYSVDADRVNLLPLYLSSLEDRLRCAGGCLRDYVEAGAPWQLPPARTTALLAVSALLVVVALAADRASRRPVLVALAAAVPVVAFYGYAGGVMNLRYLMPAFALSAVAVAGGIAVVWRRSRLGPPGLLVRAAVVAGLSVGIVWQVGYGTDRLANPATRHRGAEVAAGLEPHLTGGACVVATAVNYPQVQYWTRCPASALDLTEGHLQPPLGELGSYVDVHAAAVAGAEVYAVVRGDPPPDSAVAGWEVLGHADEFVLLRRPPDAAVPPPPCPPQDGPERELARVLSGAC